MRVLDLVVGGVGFAAAVLTVVLFVVDWVRDELAPEIRYQRAWRSFERGRR